MHIGEILAADCANGIGMRVSVFVSGCTNQCKGCFQPETWDFCYGREYTKEIEDCIIKELSKPYYKGLSILGGEPFEISNQIELVHLILRVKQECPNKDIWMYTGFIYDKDLIPGGCRYTAVTNEILQNIDVLVDGKFIESLKSSHIKFRGSSNQRIINMKESLQSKNIVIMDDFY